MSNVKSVGGLTSGRGFSEATRLLFLLSIPACGEVCKALQELTGLTAFDEGQKELRPSRRREDNAALDKLILHFSHLNPFPDAQELRSLSTGITAEPHVNTDCAVEVGTKIVEAMDGYTVAEYKFSKKVQIKSL